MEIRTDRTLVPPVCNFGRVSPLTCGPLALHLSGRGHSVVHMNASCVFHARGNKSNKLQLSKIQHFAKFGFCTGLLQKTESGPYTKNPNVMIMLKASSENKIRV